MSSIDAWIKENSRLEEALAAIGALVGDDFCEDLACRAALTDEVTGDLKVLHDKISRIYRIAHASSSALWVISPGISILSLH